MRNLVAVFAVLGLLVVDLSAAEVVSWPPPPGRFVRIRAPKTMDVPGILIATEGRTVWHVPAAATEGPRLITRVEGWEEQVAVPRPGGTLEAQVQTTDERGLIVTFKGHGGRFRIPPEAIGRIQIRGDRRSRGGQCLRIGLAGLGAGLVVTAAATATAGPLTGAVSLAGLTPALTVGGLIAGAVMTPGYQWREIPRSGVRLQASRDRAGVQVSFSF